MLETWIQMTYFERILERANTRLMVMTGGQYELQRRQEAENNRSQSGLDLAVTASGMAGHIYLLAGIVPPEP